MIRCRPRDRRSLRPADPGVAVRLGGGGRARRVVRRAGGAVAGAELSRAAFAAAARRCRRVLRSRPVELLCGLIGVFLLVADRLRRLRGHADLHRQLRADLRLRDLLARPGRGERAVRQRLQGVQPVAGDRSRGLLDRAHGGARADARAAGLPRAARPLARRGRHLPVRGARAGGLGRRRAADRRDRGARLLGGQFVGMALYGVEEWTERGDGFSRLLQRCSRASRRGARATASSACARRSRASPTSARCAGTVPLLAVMIGSVTFDGAAEAPIWTGIAPDISDFFQSLGLSPREGARADLPDRPDRGDR